MTKVNEQFAQRLIIAMQARGYLARPAVLEREFNLRYHGKPMTISGVRKWLIGTAMPSGDKIVTLAKWLEISPEELAFGKDIQQAIAQREARWQKEIGYQDKEVFEAYTTLPPTQKKILREVIMTFAKMYGGRT